MTAAWATATAIGVLFIALLHVALLLYMWHGALERPAGSYPPPPRPTAPGTAPGTAPTGGSSTTAAALRARVLAVLDGKPGSGKTTMCGFVGQAVRIVEKDFDFFTQPVVNPGHSTSRTPEGIARRARWQRLERASPSGGAKRMVEFIHREVRDYVASVDPDVVIVFCGLAHWGDMDLLPPELKDVPRYLLDLGVEETSKRIALRHVTNIVQHIPTCFLLGEEYRREKMRAKELVEGQVTDPSKYVMTSGDGAALIRAMLSRDMRVGDAAIDEIVSDYNAQPTVQQRLRELGQQRFGSSCVIMP